MKNARYLAMLVIGHLVTDINQGAMPALLPFLMTAHHLNYALVANFIFASNISSSVLQPLFGHLVDKYPVQWMMPAGIFLAGGGMAAVGFASSYWLIFLAAALSGIGVAAFHPVASRLVNKISGEKKVLAVSMFSAAGTLGFAFGPIITTLIITAFALKGSGFLVIPVTVVALVLAFNSSKWKTLQAPPAAPSSPAAVKTKKPVLAATADEWKPFFFLMGAIFCRSIAFIGISTFLPLYWIHSLHQSEAAGSFVLMLLMLVGAASSVITGYLAERFGALRIIKLGFIAAAPLLALLFLTKNIYLGTILIIPVGLTLFAPFSPMVVLGQKYLHHHIGLASGITLGLAVSIGGVFAPLLGMVADHFGIQTALLTLPGFLLLAFVLSIFLPEPRLDQKTA
ncbi:MAG: MFS transporter [Peptococcaceae bacterium]|jgi:FSR family fosmidomycin resistance protein-like MFS transporter|nr:MFS transporter [Peptococcaceae bacterium]